MTSLIPRRLHSSERMRDRGGRDFSGTLFIYACDNDGQLGLNILKFMPFQMEQ